MSNPDPDLQGHCIRIQSNPNPDTQSWILNTGYMVTGSKPLRLFPASCLPFLTMFKGLITRVLWWVIPAQLLPPFPASCPPILTMARPGHLVRRPGRLQFLSNFPNLSQTCHHFSQKSCKILVSTGKSHAKICYLRIVFRILFSWLLIKYLTNQINVRWQ
jgi:hypothetical protein